jgi:hypothetical protein
MPHEHRMDVTEDAELLAGATGAVIAADQITKSITSEDHKVSHLSKAAIGAAVAVGAYELLRRQSEEKETPRHQHHPRSRSSSPHHEHHERHLAEEIIGAYGLGKELLGDKKHHVVHLVEEVIGALGLLQEGRARIEDGKGH